MRLEDMNQEFPKMPEEMRAMIEHEVAKQMRADIEETSERTGATGNRTGADRCTVQSHRSRCNARRVFAASLAAVMLLGTTVLAGVIYQMHSRSVGKYGVEIKTEGNGESAGSGVAGTEQTGAAFDIPTVRMEVTYLPDGMVEQDGPGRYSYEDAPYEGGVTLSFYQMDTGDDAFETLQGGVIASEDITVDGYSGVYLEYQNLFEEENTFNQRIYLAYTDVHYVMEMYIGANVLKEEAIKIAEGVKLIPVADGTTGADILSNYSWSEHLASVQEDAVLNEELGESWTCAKKSDLKNTHQIGDSFAVENSGIPEYADVENKNLEASVTDVQVLDQVGLLDQSRLDADEVKDLAKITDGNSNLLPLEIQYVKNGNGVDSIPEIVKTGEMAQKLLYVTVEYKNTGKEVLSDVLYFGSLIKMEEDGDAVNIYTGEKPGSEDTWDQAYIEGPASFPEMWYYDISGGERGNNYIPSIKPGETVTVHLAWIVPEEELGYYYLNLDPWGGTYEFDEHSLAVGYVDIRQSK